MAKFHGNEQYNATNQIGSYYVDTGVADAYVVSTHPAIISLTNGLEIKFIATNSNTGTCTLNVNGLGAKTIKKDVIGNLNVNDIIAGEIVEVTYDGTNFQWTGSKFNSIQNGVVFGGQVTWQGNYDFNIEAAGYYINFQYFTSPKRSVTLAPPDGTFDRFDTFVVNNLSTAVVIQGTPAAIPVEPPLDLGTQLRLSAVLVETGSTQPTVSSQCLYLENSEWTTGGTNGGRINPNSTNNPHSGTKTIEATSPINGDTITFTTASFTPLDIYTILHLWLRAKSGWGNNQRLLLQWYNGVNPVGNSVTVQGGTFGFVKTNTSAYQEVTIPLTNFGLTPSSTVTTLRITVSTTGAFTGWYLDDMCLLDTTVTPTTSLPTFQNGIIYSPVNNTVEFGTNPLIHNTTLNTQNFIQTFTGTTVYDYPYQFIHNQSFENGTEIVSFLGKGSLVITEPDNANVVKLGINYTGAVYAANPVNLVGYMNNKRGYWIGVNMQPQGAAGIFTDDSNSKVDGIFFHTLDSGFTDAITLFAKHPPTADGDISIQPGQTGLEPYRIATFHDDLSMTLWGYGVGTFDDTPIRALGVTALGNVIEFAPSLPITADNGLNMSTATNVQLGGTLLHTTTIDVQNFELDIVGINGNIATFAPLTSSITGTDGTAISNLSITGDAMSSISASLSADAGDSVNFGSINVNAAAGAFYLSAQDVNGFYSITGASSNISISTSTPAGIISLSVNSLVNRFTQYAFQPGGGLQLLNVTLAVANYVPVPSDYLIFANDATGNINLPQLGGGLLQNSVLIIKFIGSTSVNVNADGTFPDTIDGSPSVTLTPNQVLRIYGDVLISGSTWRVI